MTHHADTYKHGPDRRAALQRRYTVGARDLAVSLEALLAWSTPSWRRNPVNAAVEIQRRGYAIYDGPNPTGDGLAGTPVKGMVRSDDTSPQP